MQSPPYLCHWVQRALDHLRLSPDSGLPFAFPGKGEPWPAKPRRSITQVGPPWWRGWELPLVLALPGAGSQCLCPAPLPCGLCPGVPCSPRAAACLPLPRSFSRGPSGRLCRVVPAELQTYENLDNYCVISRTLLAEEDAGRTQSALPVPTRGTERGESGCWGSVSSTCC